MGRKKRRKDKNLQTYFTSCEVCSQQVKNTGLNLGPYTLYYVHITKCDITWTPKWFVCLFACQSTAQLWNMVVWKVEPGTWESQAWVYLHSHYMIYSPSMFLFMFHKSTHYDLSWFSTRIKREGEDRREKDLEHGFATVMHPRYRFELGAQTLIYVHGNMQLLLGIAPPEPWFIVSQLWYY